MVHRRAFLALALLLPAILAVGLGARRKPVESGVNDSKTPANAQLLRKSDILWQRHGIQTKFYGDVSDERTVYVELRPAVALREPDPLLYWAPGQRGDAQLSPNARLLGTFENGKIFAIPVDGERSGQLVLYSGAHQTIVDVATVEKLP